MKNKTFIIAIAIILVVFGVLIFLTWNHSGTNGLPAKISSTLASTPFDAKATIKMKDLVLAADVNRTRPGSLTVKVNEPASLAGMAFAYDGEDIAVTYHGLTVKLNENSKLVSSLVSVIVNSIDKAASPSGVNVKAAGNSLVVSGKSDSGKFNLTIDKENGSIATLNVPDLDFECHFDNFLYQK